MQQRRDDNERIKLLEWELLKEREKYSLFLSLNTNCFFEYDLETQTIFFARNESFKRLNGLIVELKKETFIKQTGIFYADYELFEDLLSNSEDDEKEIRFLGDDGDYLWCRVRTAIINEGKKDNLVIGCIQNNDDNHKKLEWLKMQSQLDTLTRFYNLQYMKEYTNLYLTTHSDDLHICLFLIQIENFRQIRNNIGRLFSDTVLKNVAECLKDMFPSDVFAGRVAEDRFAILVKSEEQLHDTANFIDSIRKNLGMVYAGGNGESSVTCSIGIARTPYDGNSYETLFKRADSLLLKKDGMDQEHAVIDNSVIDLPQHQSEFAYHIMSYAQDLLSTTKDGFSAIHLLLDKVKKEFKAESVSIYEKIKGQKALEETYTSTHRINQEKKPVLYNYQALSENKGLDANGICEIREENGTELQCVFYEDGKIRGLLRIISEDGGRGWTAEERDAISALTRILSFYLFRLKMTENIQARVEHMRNYDALTGMPTSYKFKQEAKALRKENPDRNYALIYSDIDNFKYINDTYGYQFGDRILYEFALEMTRYFSEGSLFGRVSADNYVILVPYESKEELETAILAFNKNFHTIQKEKHVATNVSIISGVYFLKPSDNITTAIDKANVARKDAKQTAYSVCKFYNNEMEEKIRRDQELTNDMEEALANGEFVVYLQPKVQLRGDKLAGAEALVRWKRKDGQIIPPDDFIPLFEKNGFILQLDYYVYEEVCKIMKSWMEKNIALVPISVNVSRLHLREKNFTEKIMKLVDRYGISPKVMELELTESVFVSDTENTIQVMKQLRNYGFTVSIDDFGAGYSSLTLLKDMETDVLKLDKEFFRHGEMQQQEKIIVSSIINMAKQLNMKVISEGIETEKQMAFLKEICCDMVQGYYYAKPMPIEEFEDFMYNRVIDKIFG